MNEPLEKFSRNSDCDFNVIDTKTVKIETDEFKIIIKGTELIFRLHRYPKTLENDA